MKHNLPNYDYFLLPDVKNIQDYTEERWADLKAKAESMGFECTVFEMHNTKQVLVILKRNKKRMALGSIACALGFLSGIDNYEAFKC